MWALLWARGALLVGHQAFTTLLKMRILGTNIINIILKINFISYKSIKNKK
jgi:hypothetical protein